MGEKVTRVFKDAMHGVEIETIKNATFEDFHQSMEAMRAAWPRSGTFLASVKKSMRDLVMREGFPDPGSCVNHKGRFWCEDPRDGLPKDCAFARGWAFIQMHTEPLTPCYEAANIHLKAVEVELAIRGGDPETVFAQTLLFGTALNKFQERQRHLKRVNARRKAEYGLRFNNEGRDAANAERAENAQRWKKVAQRLSADYWEKKPKASKAEVANWITRNWPKDEGIDCPAVNTVRVSLRNS